MGMLSALAEEPMTQTTSPYSCIMCSISRVTEGVQSVNSDTNNGTLSICSRWGRILSIPRGNFAWNHHLYDWQLCYTNVYLDPNYFSDLCNIIKVCQTRGLDCSSKYHHLHHHQLYNLGWAFASSVVNIGTLLYLTTHNTLHSDSFARWLAVEHSLLSNLSADGVQIFSWMYYN